MVMEFIAARYFEDLIEDAHSGPEKASLQATALTKIAGAVAWLLGCPLVPDGDSIGPAGGGKIQHMFFAMEDAPIEFATPGTLEAYVNEVRFYNLPVHIQG